MHKKTNDNAIRVGADTYQFCEFLRDRLYFVSIPAHKDLSVSQSSHFFSIDNEFVYVNYYNDFGPLHLGHVYRYCIKVRSKLNCPSISRIIHYTSTDANKRANAAFLIASFAIVYLNMTPKEAYRVLLTESVVPFKPFQDASMGISNQQLRLSECLDGLYRALQCGFIHFNDFCVEEFELYSKIEHGDMNWIVPQKFLAFCGPVSGPEHGHKEPKDYYDYFLTNNITVVIRLSKRQYDAQSTFGSVGIKHYDLYYLDGTIPSMAILNKFLTICESEPGAIAVHCKAGLGRTGSLIGAYIIKHYRMKAKEAIAWMRICRPGSVIGKQQSWLEELEQDLWAAGEEFRRQRFGDGQKVMYHKYGIYSISEKISRSRREATINRQQCYVSPSRGRGKARKDATPSGAARTKGCYPYSCTPPIPMHYPNTCGTSESTGVGTSANRRSPSAGTMRQTTPHPMRHKKMAFNNKLTSPSMPINKQRDDETQGDKLKRAKFIREMTSAGRYSKER